MYGAHVGKWVISYDRVKSCVHIFKKKPFIYHRWGDLVRSIFYGGLLGFFISDWKFFGPSRTWPWQLLFESHITISNALAGQLRSCIMQTTCRRLLLVLVFTVPNRTHYLYENVFINWAHRNSSGSCWTVENVHMSVMLKIGGIKISITDSYCGPPVQGRIGTPVFRVARLLWRPFGFFRSYELFPLPLETVCERMWTNTWLKTSGPTCIGMYFWPGN